MSEARRHRWCTNVGAILLQSPPQRRVRRTCRRRREGDGRLGGHLGDCRRVGLRAGRRSWCCCRERVAKRRRRASRRRDALRPPYGSGAAARPVQLGLVLCRRTGADHASWSEAGAAFGLAVHLRRGQGHTRARRQPHACLSSCGMKSAHTGWGDHVTRMPRASAAGAVVHRVTHDASVTDITRCVASGVAVVAERLAGRPGNAGFVRRAYSARRRPDGLPE